MKIVKIDFEDFKSPENDNFTELSAEEETSDDIEIDVDLENAEDEKEQAFTDFIDADSIKKDAYEEGYSKAKLEFDQNLLEQNKQIENLLGEIRSKLNLIEEVQTSKVNETIDSVSEYLESLIKKLVKEPEFKKVIISKIMDSVASVLSKVKGYGSVCVEVSNNLGESMLAQVKTYLEKNNMSEKIELKTTDREDVVVRWNGGEAVMDTSKTISEINQELHRLDTTT